jgi:hypothetical protein
MNRTTLFLILAYVALVLTVAPVACLTPAEQAEVLTAEQDGCKDAVLASSIIPIGTNPTIVTADIQAACELLETTTSYVTAVVVAFEADMVDGGTAPPAGAVYVPSPMAMRAHARRVKAFGDSAK